MGVAFRGIGTKTFSQTVRHNNFKAHLKRQNTVEDPLLEDGQVYIGENIVVKHGNPFHFRNKVCSRSCAGVFFTEMKQLKPISKMALSQGARRMCTSPNAGGSSEKSEILSFELLKRCFGANLQKTETEVSYFPTGGSITDYTCTMFSVKLGVSVTRAFRHRGEFTVEDATRLLAKKLSGVVVSSRNTIEKWDKQILHVWAASLAVSVLIAEAYIQIPKYLKSNTVVLVTVADDDNEVFSN